MIQRDHGLMEPAAAPNPPSVPVSPPARDSMEDADPSLTRKRPRLDSGSKDTLAMPAEQTSVPTTAAPPREQQVEMTIRSQPPPSSYASDVAGDIDDHIQSVPAVASTAAATEDDTDVEVAVVASTEMDPVDEDNGSADSPPVIAIDDDDSGTDSSAAQIEYDAELHFQRFPFAEHGHYLPVVNNIALHFRDGRHARCIRTERC